MAAIYNGNWKVRLSTFFSCDGQVGQIDRFISGINSASLVAWSTTDLFSALLAANWSLFAQAAVSANATYLGVKTYYKPPGQPPRVDKDTVGNGAGTGGAGNLPTQVCGLVRWASAIGGPQGKGRDYMPFPWTAATSGTGHPTGAYQTACADLEGILLAGFVLPNVGGGGGTVFVRPCTIYDSGAPNFLAEPMVSLSVADGFATQRRRGFFGKLNSSPF